MRPEIRASIGRLTRWLALPLLVMAAVVAWLALDPGFRAGTGGDMTQDAFERRVRDYLLRNPEVIVEAVERLEARRRAAEESEAQAMLKSRAEQVFRDPASPVGGNPDGDVTLVEFFDYNCPYCRQVAGPMEAAEKGDPRLRIVYKEFPILGPNSVAVAKLALAAHRQGKYAAFHKALMQARGTADEASALRVAGEIGLDVERLKAEMQDAAIQTEIDRNLELARALRITGTPGFVIGTQILRGATDVATLRKLIDEARKKP
jgi:protein-disulfide isomerase